eukprot:Rhum_TRINITY_DN18694_c0_g1::Rhum_TRINITY_DN18694_c0_g1_i1::g.168113::m.168113
MGKKRGAAHARAGDVDVAALQGQIDEREEELLHEQDEAAADARMSDSGSDADDAEDEEQKILPGDEEQMVDFDVNAMEPGDVDSSFHLMQRWCPVPWAFQLDEVLVPLSKSAVTSIVKIPDDFNTDEDTQLLNDGGEHVYGVLGYVDMASLLPSRDSKVLFDALCAPATTEETSKADIATLLTPAALKEKPVCLVVSERLANLPPEVGAQLHVNMFEEMAEKAAEGEAGVHAPGHFEYFLIFVKVRLDADKELDEVEEEIRTLEQASKAGQNPNKKLDQLRRARETQKQQADKARSSSCGGRKKKVAAAGAGGDEKLKIAEDTALFTRAEEIFYFRHRDPRFAVKRYVLDPDVSSKVVIAPVVVHRNQIDDVIRDIKTLDDYFVEVDTGL